MSSPRRRALALSLGLSLALVGMGAGVAEAQAPSAYERAIAAYLEADFELSRGGAEEALEDPTTSVADLSRAHLLLALLAHVEQADRTVIESQIEDAVALDATVEAPEGSPRAFADRLTAARARAAETPTHLRIEREASGGARASVTGIPARLVHHVGLTCGGVGARSAAGGLEVSLDRIEGTCQAEIVDARGRVLDRATRELLVVTQGGPTTQGSDDTPWIVLGVVGAVLVVGGAITLGIVLGAPSQSTLGTPTVPEWSR